MSIEGHLKEIEQLREEINLAKTSAKKKLFKEQIDENQIINEVCGVSMFKYSNVIDQISAYANNYTKNFYNNQSSKNREHYCGEIKFEIDHKIVNLLNFAANLRVFVSLLPHTYNSIGEGRTEGIENAVLLNNKIYNLDICINSFYNDLSGDIDKRSFEQILYHELHHVFETYKRFSSDENGNQREPKNVFMNKCYYELRKTELDKIFGKEYSQLKEYAQVLTYRAFNTIEINAEVCGAYGELKNTNVQEYKELNNVGRQNFIQNIIRKTDAYSEYKFLSDNVNWFFSNITNGQIELWKKVYLERGIKFGNYNFKSWLYSFSIMQIKKYLRQLTHAISLYLNTKLDLRENNKISCLYDKYKNKQI